MKFGDPIMPHRFWAKIRRKGECWIWRGARGNGQPQARATGGWTRSVTRWVSVAAGGVVPAPGEACLHGCDGGALCVRPTHFGFVPQELAASLRPRPTHCARGHGELNEATAYSKPNGGWVCKLCAAGSNRRSRIRRRTSPTRIALALQLIHDGRVFRG